jgi:hypothetical protein
MGVRHFRSVLPVFLSGFAILWNMLGSYFSQGPPGGDPEERFLSFLRIEALMILKK